MSELTPEQIQHIISQCKLVPCTVNEVAKGTYSGYTVMTKFGDTSRLIDFFDRITTYYKEMLTSKDNGGLGNVAQESQPTQTP